MPERDLVKAWAEIFKLSEPPKEGAPKSTAEPPSLTSLESILPSLPPEGQAWLNGLNPFCRWAVEHDLHAAGPDLFVEYWTSLRDTLQKLERDFGPLISGSSILGSQVARQAPCDPPRLLQTVLDLNSVPPGM